MENLKIFLTSETGEVLQTLAVIGIVFRVCSRCLKYGKTLITKSSRNYEDYRCGCGHIDKIKVK